MRDVRRCIEALPAKRPCRRLRCRSSSSRSPARTALPDDSSGAHHRPHTDEPDGEDLLEELDEDLALPLVAARREDAQRDQQVEALPAHARAFVAADEEALADKTGPLFALPSDSLDDIDGLPPSLAAYPVRHAGPAEVDLAFGRPLPLSPAAGIPAARMPPPRTITPRAAHASHPRGDRDT